VAKAARPDDVSREEYARVMQLVPRGFPLVKTERVDHWRIFSFEVTRPIKGYEVGDTFEVDAVCVDAPASEGRAA
jgi:hypothetical protein